MPRKIQHRFDRGSPEHYEFVKMWNGDYKKKEIAAYFGISIPTVKRVARNLQLPKKNDKKNHPHLSYLDKRIKKMYYRGYSTIKIAQAKKINEETVRKHLERMGIERRGVGSRNVLYNDYRGYGKYKIGPAKLRQLVKKMHEQGYWPYQIANAAGVDKDVVTRRIRAMGERPKGGVISKAERSGKRWKQNTYET